MWGPPGAAQMVRGRDEVVDVGGEVGVGKVAFAGPQAGEVEPQHRDTSGSKCFGYAFGRSALLAAGEAVRKHGISDCVSGRALQQSLQ